MTMSLYSFLGGNQTETHSKVPPGCGADDFSRLRVAAWSGSFPKQDSCCKWWCGVTLFTCSTVSWCDSCHCYNFCVRLRGICLRVFDSWLLRAGCWPEEVLEVAKGSKRAVDRQRGILFDKCQCVIRVLNVLKFRIVQAKRLSQGVEWLGICIRMQHPAPAALGHQRHGPWLWLAIISSLSLKIDAWSWNMSLAVQVHLCPLYHFTILYLFKTWHRLDCICNTSQHKLLLSRKLTLYNTE